MTDNIHTPPTISDLLNFDLFLYAYNKASKGKRNTVEHFEFSKNLHYNLHLLIESIRDKTYSLDLFNQFTLKCRNTKKERLIRYSSFKDKVVQHAIYALVYGTFDRGWIHDSYGCRIGKGTLKAADRCQEYMRRCKPDEYYLQMDFRKFYYNINHTVLEESIRRKIKCNELVELMLLFIKVEGVEKGLNIGNLLSQLFGLIYLDRYDHFIKRVLKCKMYIRYVDDSVIFGLTKSQAWELYRVLSNYIQANLKLEFSKFSIRKISKGINFVGFRTWKSKRFLRKHTIANFKAAIKQNNPEAVQSIFSLSTNSRTQSTLKKMLLNKDKYNIKQRIPSRMRYDLFLYKVSC